MDFATITLRDALDLAILIEEEARDRYLEFTDQLEVHHTEESGRFFRFMASNEEKHRVELTERRMALFGDEPSTVSRSQLFDVEAPAPGEARMFMSPRAALLTALEAEKRAHSFFTGALTGVKDAQVQALFRELAAEETEHLSLVEAELGKLPPEDVFTTDDFADDAVEQD
jgi:rubrerythrin